MPVLVGEGLEGPRVRGTGVVDEDVDAAQPLGRFGDELLHGIGVGDVGDPAGSGACGRQLLFRELHLVGVARAEGHGDALGEQVRDDSAADPPRTAGDDGAATAQTELHLGLATAGDDAAFGQLRGGMVEQRLARRVEHVNLTAGRVVCAGTV